MDVVAPASVIGVGATAARCLLRAHELLVLASLSAVPYSVVGGRGQDRKGMKECGRGDGNAIRGRVEGE